MAPKKLEDLLKIDINKVSDYEDVCEIINQVCILIKKK